MDDNNPQVDERIKDSYCQHSPDTGLAGGAARENEIKKTPGGVDGIKARAREEGRAEGLAEGRMEGFMIGWYNGLHTGFHLGQGKLSPAEVKAMLGTIVDQLVAGGSESNESK